MGGNKTAGVIIREALQVYRKNFVFFLVTSLIIYGSSAVITQLINLGLDALGFGQKAELYRSAIGTLVSFLFGIILTAPISFNAYGATLSLLSGRKTTVARIAGRFAREWPRYLGLSAWETLWIFLWFFAFVIPGLVKMIAYSFAPFLMIEYPAMPVRDALRLSNKITHGYKLRLFALYLAFAAPVSLLNYLLAPLIGGVRQLPDILVLFFVNLFFLAPIYYAINSIAYMDIRPTAVKRKLIPAPPKSED